MIYYSKASTCEAYQLTRAMVEAHLFDEVPLPAGLTVRRSACHRANRTLSEFVGCVTTIHGEPTPVVEGDYVITEPTNPERHYPCKPDIFEKRWGPSPMSHPAVHASAPNGYKCSDCTMDQEPCPHCYEAWWKAKHPNVQFV